MGRGESCSDYVASDFKDVFKTAISIATGGAAGTVIDISKIALDYTYPQCDSWNDPTQPTI